MTITWHNVRPAEQAENQPQRKTALQSVLEKIEPKETEPQPQPVEKKQPETFTGVDSTRNYKAYYRAVHDFHKKYNPAQMPITDPQAYFDCVAADMVNTAAIYNNDPFLMAMLMAVLNEIEAELKRKQE